MQRYKELKDIIAILGMDELSEEEKLLADKKSDIDYAKAQAELIEAMAQIQAIQKLRKIKR